MKKYIPRTREEKMAYAKMFSKGERDSYRKGVRMGFLQGIHKRKYADKKPTARNYSQAEFDSLFDDIRNIRI